MYDCSVMDGGVVECSREYCYRDHQLIPAFACCGFCMFHESVYWARYRPRPLFAVFRLDFN